MSKDLPLKAERASEHYAHHLGYPHVWRVQRGRMYSKQDVFSCDVIAIGHPDGGKAWLQVTSGLAASTINSRKRKLAQYPWVYHDRVEVLQLLVDKSARPFRYRFAVWRWVAGESKWYRDEDVQVPREWLKVYREKAE